MSTVVWVVCFYFRQNSNICSHRRMTRFRHLKRDWDHEMNTTIVSVRQSFNGGVTGGYPIPHFRNFSALFPQIRRNKLTISVVCWAYEQSLPASYI